MSTSSQPTASLTFLAWGIVGAGLINGLALWLGFASLARSIEHKSFSSAPSITTGDSREVVPLSGDRFAVVVPGGIAVYWVDAQGQVSRLHDVVTVYEELVPARRLPEPQNPPGS